MITFEVVKKFTVTLKLLVECPLYKSIRYCHQRIYRYYFLDIHKIVQLGQLKCKGSRIELCGTQCAI